MACFNKSSIKWGWFAEKHSSHPAIAVMSFAVCHYKRSQKEPGKKLTIFNWFIFIFSQCHNHVIRVEAGLSRWRKKIIIYCVFFGVDVARGHQQLNNVDSLRHHCCLHHHVLFLSQEGGCSADVPLVGIYHFGGQELLVSEALGPQAAERRRGPMALGSRRRPRNRAARHGGCAPENKTITTKNKHKTTLTLIYCKMCISVLHNGNQMAWVRVCVCVTSLIPKALGKPGKLCISKMLLNNLPLLSSNADDSSTRTTATFFVFFLTRLCKNFNN